MKVLVTGRDGQVAQGLAECAPLASDCELVFAARPELDLAVRGSFARMVQSTRPDVVINAAAYTAVDAAEAEEELARRINALAAGEGAEAAARVSAKFIQISTDYVFDGSGTRAWREDDPTAPINAYGRTKLEGEQLVLAASPDHVVVRTSWLVGPFGRNFIRTMLRLADERDEIAVVDDQRGCPTSTLDLADGVLKLACRASADEASGIYHLAGNGDASWAELAEFAIGVSRTGGDCPARIRPIATSEFPTDAERPRYSVLDCTKAHGALGIRLPSWRQSIETIVHRIREGRDAG